MRPRLEAIYFGSNEYTKLARVLELTAKLHNPNWDINVRKVNGHNLTAALASKYVRKSLFENNAHKALIWCEIVQESQIGDKLLLMDSDTYVRGNLDEIWNLEFDFARTIRDYKWPWNSGVMFLRINEFTKLLFKEITEMTFRMLSDPVLHEKYESLYGGIHQAATSAIIDSGTIPLHVIDIPCRIWNSGHVERDEEALKDSKIVHLLPSGRKEIFGSRWAQKKYWRIVGREWWDYFSQVDFNNRWDEIIERLKILKQDRSRLEIAEIGVWQGDSTVPILRSGLVDRIHLVDPWKAGVPGTTWHESQSKMPRYHQKRFNAAKKMVRHKVKDFDDKVVFYEVPSLEAVKYIPDNSLDLVFIDADHSYEGVYNDIQAWLPKVKDGGFICGHDLDEPRFPGVRRAVEEIFNISEVEIGDDFTWFYRLSSLSGNELFDSIEATSYGV